MQVNIELVFVHKEREKIDYHIPIQEQEEQWLWIHPSNNQPTKKEKEKTQRGEKQTAIHLLIRRHKYEKATMMISSFQDST